ncbi:hypothetical protein QZJ86_10645 [Methylomonas montana]|nr:hypothetical protein [Methylomonas montana]WKJ92573.1 hypothetical protein QZJ86_10645 [Methylomonas montana]
MGPLSLTRHLLQLQRLPSAAQSITGGPPVSVASSSPTTILF